jgi:hypothetical protein
MKFYGYGLTYCDNTGQTIWFYVYFNNFILNLWCSDRGNYFNIVMLASLSLLRTI